MAALKELLLEGEVLDGGSKMCLTCAGIALARRIATDIELPETNAHMRITLALLFVLVVLGNQKAPMPSGAGPSSSSMEDEEQEDQDQDDAEMESEPTESLLQIYGDHSVADMLYATTSASTNSWMEQLKDPGALCRSALTEASLRGHELDIDALSALGATFFRASADAMAVAMFNSCSPPGDDFLTLQTVGFLSKANDNKSEKLASIADVAESEAGQTILRDLILSFTLPRKVVSVRRTCLLTREANAAATAEHTEILNNAHEAAMHGAQYCWAEDSNEIHKMSALLAGIAVLLCANTHSIRKDDAFAGRFDAPFLETRPPAPGVPRLALLQASSEWVVYATNTTTGKPIVELRAAGFEGLCQAALAFVGHLRL